MAIIGSATAVPESGALESARAAQSAAAAFVAPTKTQVLRPEQLNGDDPLTSSERRAYVEFHAQRNKEQAAASRGVETMAAPCACVGGSAKLSPARVAMRCFFDWAARELRSGFSSRAAATTEVTILDIGCGDGIALEGFERAGYRGRYIGLDIARSRKWRDGDTPAFTRDVRIEDAHEINPATLPELDFLISATALEHLRDDGAVLTRLATRLRPRGAQVHFVPGEAALPLYGPHGWRQYSPACLRSMFPRGEIYRFGGALGNGLHRRAITVPAARGAPTLGERRPMLYRMARDAASVVDRAAGNRPAAMYGVIVR